MLEKEIELTTASEIQKPLDNMLEAVRSKSQTMSYSSTNKTEGYSGGKLPPHSVESEQSVIGAILLDNEVANSVVEFLAANDFYKHSHQLIFQAILEIYERREAIDIITLSNQLRGHNQLDTAGGLEYLSALLDIVPTSANVIYYGKIVREMSLRRQIIHEAGEIVTEAFDTKGDVDEFLDNVEHRIFKVADSRTKASFARVGEVVKDSIKQVEQLYIRKEPITGVATGFTDFDLKTYGLHPGDLVIVAGRPSMGKTSLAMTIARNVSVKDGKTVAVFSLEMSKEQIVMRMLCSEARVNSHNVKSGKLGDSDFPRLVSAASRIAQSEIYIDDTAGISILEMRAKCRRLHRERPLSLIVVDYLQLMRGSSRRNERRDQEISEISGSLKGIAKELGVPVIALSQLNRAVETRNDKRPIMADLRESGAIEQDADIICFVYRDEVYNPETDDKGVAELIISKHRNGPIGTVRLAFHGEYTAFENLTEDANYDYLGSDLSFGSSSGYSQNSYGDSGNSGGGSSGGMSGGFQSGFQSGFSDTDDIL